MALVEKKVVRRNPEKKVKKAIAQEAKGKAFTAKETKVKKDVRAKKKQKLPPGGISLGSSSTTTWKQTPTSKAVDDRAYKKKAKRWLASKNKSWADQPIRPSRVGSVAQVKRKTDAKGNTRSNFSGPGGMKPKHMDLYGNWLEKKEKLKKKK